MFSGIGGAALGSVRAKTGNLGTVTALAGLVTDKNGTTLVFAFMADQIPAVGMLRTAAVAIDEAAAALANRRPPVTGPGDQHCRQHVPLDCEQHADD